MEGETIVVTVPGGPALEARLEAPNTAAGGFVLCHPHPLYGGDWDNPVVSRAAEVAQSARYATLRFNFRGVGGAEGTHDQGLGEQDDVKAAIAALAARLPAPGPVGVIGYSFGAHAAARATRPGDAALGLIAPPLGMYDFSFLGRGAGPVLLAAGTRDSYCPLESLRGLAETAGATAQIIEGADHFFFGKLYPLGEAIGAWLGTLRSPA